MKGQKALFSKSSDEWETQKSLFELLDKEFHFIVDAAATKENTLCKLFMSASTDDGSIGNALTNVDWVPRCGSFWLNPPYGQIKAFMKKAYEESLKGATVVCLIPSRTDTVYWHDYCMKAHEIRFVKRRLKFNNRTLPSYREDGSHKVSGATFPSSIIIFDHNKYDKNNDPLLKIQEQHDKPLRL